MTKTTVKKPSPIEQAQLATTKIALSLRDITLITPMSYDEARTAVQSGKLPHKRGAKNKIMVLRSDLDAYLAAL